MQIELSEIEYCKVGIKYEADTDAVKDKRNFVAKEMAKTYDVKGFRKGKATAEVIKITYPKEVDSHLKQEMINQAYSDALTEKNIKPFGGPSLESVVLNGNKFECSLTVHTIPEFELKTYKGFDIPKHTPSSSVEEVAQQILQELRVEHSESIPYSENDFVQLTDNVIVQYSTSFAESGEAIEKLSSEATVLEVGRINIPGFDDNLLGMKTGEEREFSLRSPEKDFDPDFLNMDLKFKVKLIGGSKKVPAALDDMMAQKIGLKDFDELNTKAHGVAGAKIQGLVNGHYQDQISRRLIAEHDFVVPFWISEPEAKIQCQMNKRKWEDLTEEEKTKGIKDAEDGVKLSLILNKVQEEEPEAQLTQEELLNLATKNISQYTQNVDKVMQDIYERGQINALLSRVRDEFTLNFILNNCNIIE